MNDLRPLSEARLLSPGISSGRSLQLSVNSSQNRKLAVTEVLEGACQKVQRAFPRRILDRRATPGGGVRGKSWGKKENMVGDHQKVYEYTITTNDAYTKKIYIHTAPTPYCLRLSRSDSSLDLCYVLLGRSFFHLLRGFENLAVNAEMLTLEREVGGHISDEPQAASRRICPTPSPAESPSVHSKHPCWGVSVTSQKGVSYQSVSQ